MALFGHSGSHAPQLMHSFVIIVAMEIHSSRLNLITCFVSGLSTISAVVATLGNFMLAIFIRRRTQVVKGEVCKTSMQRFESARRLQILLYFFGFF